MKNMATYTTFYVSGKTGNDWNTGENPVSIGATDGPGHLPLGTRG